MTILDPITGKLVTINLPAPMKEMRQEQAWHLHKACPSQRAARHYRIHWAVASR